MKKNKRTRRIFSRVLDRLTWANVYRIHGGNDSTYKAVLAAKRLLEECGFEDVKVMFYAHEYHIQFTVYRYRDGRRRYYTVSASHGYVNEYHRTNRQEMRKLINAAEISLDCTLRRDFYDYQFFLHVADDVLYWGLPGYEYRDYYNNGKIEDIPFDVAVNLSRKLRGCLGDIANEAVACKKVVL